RRDSEPFGHSVHSFHCFPVSKGRSVSGAADFPIDRQVAFWSALSAFVFRGSDLVTGFPPFSAWTKRSNQRARPPLPAALCRQRSCLAGPVQGVPGRGGRPLLCPPAVR